MFKKKAKNQLYCFKDFEQAVRRASVKYGDKDKAYLEAESWYSKLFIWLAAFIPRIVDFNVRLWDFWRNRSYEGRLEGIFIVGHSPIALLLPVGLLYFMFFGPSGGRWNTMGFKWILPLAAAIMLVVLGTPILVRMISGRSMPASRFRIFDLVRLAIWSLVTAIVVAGFSRGFWAHAGFFTFTLALWATFAIGSHLDKHTQTKRPNGVFPLLMRFPWVCVFFLIVGFASFLQYVKPMEKETGTGVFWFWIYVIVIAAVFLISAGLFMRSTKEAQRYGNMSLWFQLGIVTAAGWLIWYLGGLREIEHEIYRHVLIPLTLVMLVVPLTVASVLARIIFRLRIKMVGSKFHHLLERVEVFGRPELPPLNPNKVLRSFLVTLRHVLMLLFPPALVVFLTPYFLKAYLDGIGLTVLLVTFGLLGYANIHDRLGHLISIYRGMFFHGMQVVVSTIVIVLGLTRLADLGYVSYIVEASPFTLLTFVLVAYLLLWFSEYWINRMFGEEFLALLDPERRACGKVDFDYDNDDAYRESVRTRVKAKGRRIQLHGSGRMVVVGDRQWFEKNPTIEFNRTGIPNRRKNCVVISPVNNGYSLGIFDADGNRLMERDKQLTQEINANSEEVGRLRNLCEQGEAGEAELLEFFENRGAIELKNQEEEKHEKEKKLVDEEKGWNGKRFQFFDKFDFLDHLVENAVLSDFDFNVNSYHNSGIGGDMVVRKRLTRMRNQLRWHVRDLRKQYVSYYAMLTMILVAGIVFQVLTLTSLVDPPALSSLSSTKAASVPAAGEPWQDQNFFGLRNGLFRKTGGQSGNTSSASNSGVPQVPEPVILIAASGGGTRAALYTVSVLQGLAELGRLEDVKLVSGVSGGGAALAYFYEHRRQLLKDSRGQHWADFYDAVSKGFIVRCLQGAGERRVAGGVRLGRLLDEGFQDHFFAGTTPAIGGKEIGILFNTAVAGEIHRPQTSDIDLALWAQENPELAKSWAAGTRLVVTNILEANRLKGIHEVARDGLRYTTVVHPDAKLSTAAALNANFPPVFSNAAVDIERHRYWVTDGGAMDNRGLITLLYVLRQALMAEMDRLGGAGAKSRDDQAGSGEIKTEDDLRGGSQFIYPDIHIIVADASATSFDYTPMRGFGALFGTSRKLATGLIEELSEEAQALYARIHGEHQNKIHIHNLAMPLALRARGGLGTHWMMPLMARFNSCTKEDPGEDESITLTRNQIIRAIAGLHQPDGRDNIGHLIIQDPWLVRRQGDENNLDEIVSWYSNDAIYLKGYAFRGDGDSANGARIKDESKATNVNSHPKAWEKIAAALRKH